MRGGVTKWEHAFPFRNQNDARYSASMFANYSRTTIFGFSIRRHVQCPVYVSAALHGHPGTPLGPVHSAAFAPSDNGTPAVRPVRKATGLR